MITWLLDPMRGTRNGLPVLVIALTAHAYTTIGAVIVEDDGTTKAVPLEDINVDFRYDAKTDQWVDANLGPPER